MSAQFKEVSADAVPLATTTPFAPKAVPPTCGILFAKRPVFTSRVTSPLTPPLTKPIPAFTEVISPPAPAIPNDCQTDPLQYCTSPALNLKAPAVPEIHPVAVEPILISPAISSSVAGVVVPTPTPPPLVIVIRGVLFVSIRKSKLSFVPITPKVPKALPPFVKAFGSEGGATQLICPAAFVESKCPLTGAVEGNTSS